MPPTQRGVRVPPGVTVFDAASWNGIAIDSTCGGHGTCHKCKIRVEGGQVPITRHDVRTFSSEQIADGWRLGCLVQATRDLTVEVPPLTTRPKAATVGIGRQVILRPAAAEALRRARGGHPRRPAHRPGPADRRHRGPRAHRRPARAPPAVDGAARGRLQGDRGDRRRGPDRRRARRHHARPATRSPSTSAPPPWSGRCSTSAPARRSRSPRCSTSSSRSAATSSPASARR